MLSLSPHRIIAYSLFSSLALALTISNAFRNYSNFYSVAIYLSKSSRSVLVLANAGFLLALFCGHVIQYIFFGTLRPSELERLYDRLWFFITESLLAFTIFRDEFDIPFALMFGFLLFVKSFHWLAADRIEWMDQVPYPGPPVLFHIRMSSLFIILLVTDLIMFLIAVENTLVNGVGGMVLFANEYGILVASVMNTIFKYLLSVYELRQAGRRGGENAPQWENKSMWVFYIELATDFLKLTTYLIFFLIIIAFYGLPLNIIRDVYITTRSFISRLRALHRYQTATRNMDQRYPNASEEELRAMSDRTCIICREEMVAQEPGQTPAREGPNMTPKKLPCSHVFHFHCLRSWLERQQSCPTCRRTVLDNTPTAAVQPPAPGANVQQPDNAANARNIPRNNNLPPARNALGFLGRFFAPPVQAPVGGLLPVNPPGNVNLPNAAGQVPQEVLIQYHIQYQGQRQPPELQPIPQFQGFVRPGGAWQPWPAQAAALNDQQRQQNNPPPDAGQVQTQPEADVTPAGSSNSRSESQGPREAAALAALRRLEGHRINASTNGIASPSSSSTSGHEPAVNTREAINESSLPELVPLYNLNNVRVNDGSSVNQRTQQVSTESRHSQSINRFGTTAPIQPGTARVHDTSRSLPQSNLPPPLTDEQLAIMDQVTREAIDERLRVLEGVSVAIYRCIDDLVRMRSALPSPTSPSNHSAGTDQAVPDVHVDASRDLGKAPQSVEATRVSTMSGCSSSPETDDTGTVTESQ
ncbi:hypothetical protein AMATHDRAFT_141066 [Amanita thiersii Skay4041]|uniref:RING-type E3 ubiquitin transferase n=1 Tax=Amanita thiersii Skay4041 TaxID=703135 RepID=A0A2A9NWC5_9AGAR|nr:hypothetical protein AMATHDRAFT_141066 [Amanita thiersii Skay4041]